MDTAVFLGLGSNIEPDKHLPLALDALQHRYGALRCSTVYQSEAIGFVGDDFLNMVVGLTTGEPLVVLAQRLRELELTLGRPADARKNSARTIDIDILLYGDEVRVADPQLPRAEITHNAFVLRPLAELIPEQRHPVLQQTYATLWQQFNQPQRLSPVTLAWPSLKETSIKL